jgi:hypothetical protein
VTIMKMKMNMNMKGLLMVTVMIGTPVMGIDVRNDFYV